MMHSWFLVHVNVKRERQTLWDTGETDTRRCLANWFSVGRLIISALVSYNQSFRLRLIDPKRQIFVVWPTIKNLIFKTYFILKDAIKYATQLLENIETLKLKADIRFVWKGLIKVRHFYNYLQKIITLCHSLYCVR